MSNLKKIPIEQTTLSNDFTNTYKSEVEAAFTNNHTHSNKPLLDGIISSGNGTQYLSNNGSYKTLVGALTTNNLGTITSDITLTANTVTKAHVNSAIVITLPTNLVDGIENKCIFNFTSASSAYPASISASGSIKWNKNNNGMPPVAYSNNSSIRNVLKFSTHDGGTTWEAEYTTYGVVEIPFSRPNLWSNGTLGGTAFACAATYEGYGAAYCVFDGNPSSSWGANQGVGDYIIFYNPNALKVTELTITNGTEGITAYALYGSNDNATYTYIGSGNTIINGTTITSFANIFYYKYYKLVATNYFNRARFCEIGITATYVQT